MRTEAAAHAEALVRGDLRRAGSAWYAWNDEVKAMASSTMSEMPAPIEGAEILSVEESGDHVIVLTRYTGGEKATTVESRWEERGGEVKMVKAKVSPRPF